MTLGVAPYYDIRCYTMLRHGVLPHVTTLVVAQVDPMLRHGVLSHVTTLEAVQVEERAYERDSGRTPMSKTARVHFGLSLRVKMCSLRLHSRPHSFGRSYVVHCTI